MAFEGFFFVFLLLFLCNMTWKSYKMSPGHPPTWLLKVLHIAPPASFLMNFLIVAQGNYALHMQKTHTEHDKKKKQESGLNRSRAFPLCFPSDHRNAVAFKTCIVSTHGIKLHLLCGGFLQVHRFAFFLMINVLLSSVMDDASLIDQIHGKIHWRFYDWKVLRRYMTW